MSLGTAVVTFAVVALALTVTPGLDTALVLRAALTRGRREAAATAAGIVAGLFVWGATAAVGVSALLTASQLAYDVLRYAGAAYLAWFGLRLLVRAVRGTPESEPAGLRVAPRGARHGRDWPPTCSTPRSASSTWRCCRSSCRRAATRSASVCCSPACTG